MGSAGKVEIDVELRVDKARREAYSLRDTLADMLKTVRSKSDGSNAMNKFELSLLKVRKRSKELIDELFKLEAVKRKLSTGDGKQLVEAYNATQKFGAKAAKEGDMAGVAVAQEQLKILDAKIKAVLGDRYTKFLSDIGVKWQNVNAKINKDVALLEGFNKGASALQAKFATMFNPATFSTLGAVFAKFSGTIDAITSKLTTMFNGLSATVGPVFSEIRSRVGDIVGKIAQIGGTLTGAFQSSFSIIKTIFVSISSTISASLSPIVTKVKSAMSIIASEASKAGEALAKIQGGFQTIYSTLSGCVSKIKMFAKQTLSAMSAFVGINKNVKATNNSLRSSQMSMKTLIRMVAQYGFGFRSVYFLVRRLRTFLMSGFKNVLEGSFKQQSGPLKDYANAIYNLKAAIETLRYAIVGAFAPLVTAVVPYIQKAIEWVTRLIGVIGQFIAYLRGSSTYLRAIKKGVDDVTKAASKENKQLSKLDKLNNLTTSKSGGDSGAVDPGTVLEEVPIEPWIKKWAENIKKLLNDLLYPIKAAWNNVKAYVIAGWKYMTYQMKALLKQVWKDFITMWKEPATIKMFETFFNIIGDIEFIIGTIANKLREALVYENNGLKIWEALRDILAVILTHIHNMTEATLKWAKSLDLTPIVTAIRKWLESIVPVADAIWGVVEDFWNQVILPFGKYLLETFFPKLFKRLEEFNKKVDWEGLRSAISGFWSELEPVLENVAEALLIIVDRLLVMVEQFLNTGSTGVPAIDAILGIIQKLWDTLKYMSPEEIADTIQNVAGAFLVLKGALLAITGLSGVVKLFSAIGSILSGIWSFGSAVANILNTVWGLISDIFTLITTGTAGTVLLGIVAAIGGAVVAVKEFFDMWSDGWDLIKTIFEYLAIIIATVGVIILAPIEGVGIAIAAMVGAAIFLISQIAIVVHQNWDSICSFVQSTVSTVVGAISGVLGPVISIVSSVFTYIATFVGGVISSIANFFKELFTVVTGVMQGIGIVFRAIFTVVSSIVKPILENIKTGVKEAYEFVIGKIKDTVAGIKTKLAPLVAFFRSIFNAIKTNIITPFANGVLKVFKLLGTGIIAVIKSVVNGFISKIEGLLNLIVSAINLFLGGINKIVSAAAAVTGDSWSPIPEMTKVSIPRLAQGTVVPPSASQFAAILGDNNKETEVVSPLSTMKQALQEALMESGLGGNGDIVVQIDGYEVFRATQRQASRYNKRTGRPAFS